MRERAQMLGGALVIDTSPGNGTRILSRVKTPFNSLITS
jgi:signal transduction histidine kinase